MTHGLERFAGVEEFAVFQAYALILRSSWETYSRLKPAGRAAMAFPNENGRNYANSYTVEEAEMVDKAKRTHRETTQSAQRALKVFSLPLICKLMNFSSTQGCRYHQVC